ncbi:hypothetical protein IG631_17095 [Alternaria alternata]|nr:hypothetical protein IG631_17095 [Alternaria alternata]
MFLQLLLVASAYRIGVAYAHPIQIVSPRGYVKRSTIQSQSLSVEAIVGVIAVVLAIFGIALPFMRPRLRSRLDSRRRSHSRPDSTAAGASDGRTPSVTRIGSYLKLRVRQSRVTTLRCCLCGRFSIFNTLLWLWHTEVFYLISSSIYRSTAPMQAIDLKSSLVRERRSTSDAVHECNDRDRSSRFHLTKPSLVSQREYRICFRRRYHGCLPSSFGRPQATA